MRRRAFLSSTAAAVALSQTHAPAQSRGGRALVLTGAGALGAYEAGAAIALLRAGEQFDMICGTSIGAINGAFLAMGALDELERVWHTIASFDLIRPGAELAPLLRAVAQLGDTDRGVLSRPYNVLHGASVLYDRGRVFNQTGFFESEPIADFLRAHLDLRRVSTTFAWSVTNLNTALSEAFYIAPASVPDLRSHAAYRVHRLTTADAADAALFPEAIRASSAIPLVFSPVRLQPPGAPAASYVDGGVAQNAPIGVARHLGADEIVGITAAPPSELATISSLFDVIYQAYAANQNRLIFAQLADGTTGSRLKSNALVQPQQPLTLGVLDFDKQALLDEAFARGVEDGRKGPIPIASDIPVS